MYICLTKKPFMKSFYFLFVFTLILLYSCINESNNKNDLLNDNLSGSVKSLKETSYEAIEKFGEVVKGEKKRSNNFIKDSYILYNKEGNVIEINEYNSKGHIIFKKVNVFENGLLVEEKEYSSDEYLEKRLVNTFDINKNCIEKLWYDSSGYLLLKVTYKYNENNQLIESNDYGTDNSHYFKTLFVYNDNGYLIENNQYQNNGNLNRKSIYKYDKEGNQIEKHISAVGGGFIKYSYSYNKKGLVTEEISYDAYGNVSKKISSIYDNFDNLIETTIIYNKDNVVVVNNFVYQYDKNKNWIKKIIYKNKIPVFIIEREIDYY